MQIVQKPGHPTSSVHTCPFHERNPGKSYAGCTCSASFGWEEKPMSEWTEDERGWYFATLAGEDWNEINRKRLEDENAALRKRIAELEQK